MQDEDTYLPIPKSLIKNTRLLPELLLVHGNVMNCNKNVSTMFI